MYKDRDRFDELGLSEKLACSSVSTGDNYQQERGRSTDDEKKAYDPYSDECRWDEEKRNQEVQPCSYFITSSSEIDIFSSIHDVKEKGFICSAFSETNSFRNYDSINTDHVKESSTIYLILIMSHTVEVGV